MDVNMQKLLFELVGGLGIFLFSIKFMGDGLKNFAGDKIRDWIEKFTNTPVKGALVGILVT
ncbi:MAG: sodium-dependent phosphate transporter, partial [Culicoidibacterales bacterium]